VLPELIAMSVPATGMTALYRNPLKEVVRFLETRHGADGYTIINCCPELPYDGNEFASGVVRRYDIQVPGHDLVEPHHPWSSLPCARRTWSHPSHHPAPPAILWQDHTPPTMEQFVEFLNEMRTKPPERLLAVHCRGGKGRT
jgi:hypothetical protein